MTVTAFPVRDVDAILAGRIVHTNLAVTAAHLRRLANTSDPARRHTLRDALLELDRVRRTLEAVL